MIRFIAEAVQRLLRGIVTGAARVVWSFVRPALKVASVLLLLAAVVALTSDVTRWQTGAAGPTFETLEATIRATAPATLDAIGTTIASQLHPLVWDPLVLGVLRLPAWIVLLAFALGFSVAARERRQIDIFVN